MNRYDVYSSDYQSDYQSDYRSAHESSYDSSYDSGREESYTPQFDTERPDYAPVKREIAVTLQEERSMATLAVTWRRKVVPYLGQVLLHMSGVLFFCALMLFALVQLVPHSARDCFNVHLFGFSFIVSSLMLNLLLLTKLITYWFTGPQAIFLCVAIAILFFTAARVFRLKFIKNGHTTARIDHDSIIVSKNWLNIFFCETTIKWYELALVSIRTNNVDGKMEELLSFATTGGKKIELDAGCLKDARLRANLIALIKRYAPGALSNELEEKNHLLESSSYTDIWMDTLHQKHNRQKSGELARGEALSNERFHVVKKLGSGGQGTAYLATVQYICDKVLNEGDNVDVEMVVLKEFILPGFDNPALLSEIVARIQHEALLLKSLNHRQIVRVVDAFIEDLRGYLVIEHVDGTSLRDVVKQDGPLKEPLAIELAAQMCSILEYLHGHAPQVVHRDFTPDNLIIDEKGMLKLIDFNLAKVPNLNDTSLSVGKPSYMAPEQVRGRPEPASDFYSMGALLHFILTGEDPEPLNTCSPKQINPEISASLNNLIERLTCQETDMRINTASQVRKMLCLQGVIAA
ncbi:MAG: serine/threonine protein kinase [Candidatus Melainabacteria bacterium]|nr:serine/threonine protein kinase [Candidatus Melainabacteria bacterium]